MEWSVPVNEMLRDDITKITHTLVPPGFHGDVRQVRVVQESLSRTIDALGEQSAQAQGLSKVITTAEKLRNAPTHTLYLLKDPKAKGGRGEAIGLLKVGRKHLFLFDERDTVREVEPLCVLDFYVRADRQRHGHGRRLFDHMLQEEGVRAEQLAVDGPSAKMEQFLRKNYGVERLLRQNNNFAVAPQFFATSNDVSLSGRSTPAAAPAVGRFAAHKPPSAIATVIHGGGGYFPEVSAGTASSRPRLERAMNSH
ncbi:alpha-tubulin N-acetyltransferase 1-like isoform X2 [Pectinophora gossypiella]|uniref:alpha-tubulin N-acetyltransferase 1-like isoform X2 n=1 Tax=Pectinophora gossypiella TaxID=13191 RepID=UPI00214E61E9|nr:alpha-tubulin N-acetyltransferase 1-like isoform X2 [Pectinophora gossypiella]